MLADREDISPTGDKTPTAAVVSTWETESYKALLRKRYQAHLYVVDVKEYFKDDEGDALKVDKSLQNLARKLLHQQTAVRVCRAKANTIERNRLVVWKSSKNLAIPVPAPTALRQ